MKTLKQIGLSLTLLAAFSSCKKSEPLSFSAPASLSFEYFTKASGQLVNTREINYSFLVNPNDQHTLAIPVLVNGFAVDYDRPFELEVVQDSITNAESAWYEILPGKIRAGRLIDTAYVTVKKAEALESRVARLLLRIKPNEHFEAGIREKQDFNVSWSNVAIMPTWGTLFRTFFSQVGSTEAYRIFVLTTGLTNFTNADLRPYGQAGAEVLGTKFGDYIKQWNLDHPDDIKKHDDGPSKGMPIVARYWTKSKYGNTW